MKRFLSSLFAGRRDSDKSRTSTSRKRIARVQVEPLEGRELMSVVPAGGTPTVVANVHNQILTDVNTGYQYRNSNEGVAIAWYNAAAVLAGAVHDPLGLEDVSIGWANLPARSDGSTGWGAENFYVQAIAAAAYWYNPTEGAGSGTDYAWGTFQLQQVINQANNVSNTLLWTGAVNRSYASGIVWLAENNQIYLNNMTDQFAPPLAAGSWQLNVGGVTLSYTLTQYVGYAYGQISGNGRQGTITETAIRDMNQQNSKIAPNTLFGSAFTIKWNDGTSQTGYAEQSPQNSGHMYIYYLQSNNQYIFAGTAYRTSGTGWAP